MKNYINIILLLGVLLMALSCVGTEGLDEIPNGEICMSPVLSDMTKTRAGGATNPYPDGSSFGVFAYYNQTQPYFENHKFTSEDGVCAGDGPVYWPLSGSLIFAGYSPYEAGADTAFDPATKTLTINDYIVDGTKDLMYFLPELSDGNYVGYDKSTPSVPVKFHHALSCVSINVAAKSGDEANIKLKRITLKDVYTQGDFSVIASVPATGTWEDKGSVEDKDLHINNEGSDLSSSLDFQYFIIPGDASEIEIVYLDRGVEKSHSIIPADHIAVWNQGLRYQYNITLSVGLDPVVIDPFVEILPKYEGGMLTGSVVNVDLGLSQEELDRIKDLKITVKDSEEIVSKSSEEIIYKSYEDADNVANAISFDSGGDRLYVPSQNGQKEYNVIFTYHDGLDYRSVTKIVTPEPPVFSCHISYVTLLNQLRIRKAYVTISDDVLKEVKMTSNLRIHHGGGYDVDELNVEYESSCYMNERSIIGLSPSNKYTFGQTSVKFDGVAIFPSYNGKDDKTFVVPSSYSIGERVELASNLEPNVKYALSLNKDYSASPQPYWSSNPGYLAYQSFYSTNNDSVFLYERDDSQKHTKADDYNYSSAGAWISASNFKYLDADFRFSTTPTYFTCASVWGTENYEANKLIVDIYCNSNSSLLNRSNSGYFWGNGGVDAYKWNVYKVIDNY